MGACGARLPKTRVCEAAATIVRSQSHLVAHVVTLLHRQQSAIKALGFPVLLILEVVDGPFKGAMWEIGDEGCTIVRNPKGISCVHMRLLQQVQIPDPDVSRQHATIFWSDGVARLRDLGSLNGSFLNGVRLSPEKVPSDACGVEIRGGDEIILGRSKMQVFFRVVVPEEGAAGAQKRAAAEEKRKQREQRTSERKFRLQMQVHPCPASATLQRSCLGTASSTQTFAAHNS